MCWRCCSMPERKLEREVWSTAASCFARESNACPFGLLVRRVWGGMDMDRPAGAWTGRPEGMSCVEMHRTTGIVALLVGWRRPTVRFANLKSAGHDANLTIRHHIKISRPAWHTGASTILFAATAATILACDGCGTQPPPSHPDRTRRTLGAATRQRILGRYARSSRRRQRRWVNDEQCPVECAMGGEGDAVWNFEVLRGRLGAVGVRDLSG